MSTTTTIQQLNRELGDKLIDEVKHNPQSAYAGKFVGIANGQVVVVTDDMQDLGRRLQESEPDSGKCYCLDFVHDFSQTYYIWGIF